MEPAASITSLFGGSTKLAALLGLHRTQVWKWAQPKTKGGGGGQIPQRHHRALLDAARRGGFALAAEDFLPAVEPDVDDAGPRAAA